MSEPMHRNEDGSLEPAKPLDWQHVPGGDWEMYLGGRPYEAHLFHEELLMEVVTARTRIGLALKMRRANRKHEITSRPSRPGESA